MARALSRSGEEVLRRHLGDNPRTDKLIHDIAVWEPRPPRSYAVTGKVPYLTERAKDNLRRSFIENNNLDGLAKMEKLIIEIDEWARQFNERKARTGKSTLWTPERMASVDKSAAERARRYRERRRLAKLAMIEAERAPAA
jgi:hypothetical protein